MKPTITTKYSIFNILKHPEKYIDEYSDTEILTLPDDEAVGGILRILVGMDEDGKYYLVIEDDYSAEDIYPENGETLIETFVQILDKNIERESGISECLRQLMLKYPTLDIECTCPAFPEQYEIYDKEDEDYPQIGYIRLRDGSMTVECPDVGDECVYKFTPNGTYFFEDDERKEQLEKSLEAIVEWKNTRSEAIQTIKTYILADTHRLEDYANHKIYFDLDFDIAVAHMDVCLDTKSNKELLIIVQAIEEGLEIPKKYKCK